MKKVKLESLDELESDLLAYNILDIQNTKQIEDYKALKGKKKKNLTVKEVNSIIKPPKKSLDEFRRKEIEMKKNVSTNY